MPKRQEMRVFRPLTIRFTKQYSPIDLPLALCRLSAKPRLLFDGIEVLPEQGRASGCAIGAMFFHLGRRVDCSLSLFSRFAPSVFRWDGRHD